MTGQYPDPGTSNLMDAPNANRSDHSRGPITDVDYYDEVVDASTNSRPGAVAWRHSSAGSVEHFSAEPVASVGVLRP